MKGILKVTAFALLYTVCFFVTSYAQEFEVTVTNSNIVSVTTNFSENEKFHIVLTRRGANMLFDFHSWSITDEKENVVFEQINDTDCFSPYIVFADERAFGDNQATFDFTGGNHDYSNHNKGMSQTARSEGVHVYVDDVKMNNYRGKASKLQIKTINAVQGSNTKRENGYGKEVLREEITMAFDGKTWQVKTVVTALCDITIRRFYGYSLYANAFGDNVEYLYSDRKSINRFYNGYYSYSTGKNCRGIYLGGGKVDVVLKLSGNTDTETYNTSEYSAFFTDYGKMYFNIIYGNNPKKLLKGEKFETSGSYQFLKPRE